VPCLCTPHASLTLICLLSYSLHYYPRHIHAFTYFHSLTHSLTHSSFTVTHTITLLDTLTSLTHSLIIHSHTLSHFSARPPNRLLTRSLHYPHFTAVTVSPEYRRLGVAKKLMCELEEISTEVYNGFFVDLFVRCSNALAISMYNHFGYTTYRRVLGYYGSEEDALDMRKALPRDVKKESVVPMTRPITPDELEW
jgi:GNAT superfamily N-acetyltransferase